MPGAQRYRYFKLPPPHTPTHTHTFPRAYQRAAVPHVLFFVVSAERGPIPLISTQAVINWNKQDKGEQSGKSRTTKNNHYEQFLGAQVSEEQGEKVHSVTMVLFAWSKLCPF